MRWGSGRSRRQPANVGTNNAPKDIPQEPLNKVLSYAEHKELQKRKNRLEKAIKQHEAKIEQMEQRLKELDELLMQPENASDMTMVTEYTSVKRDLDEEVDRWEKASEELESLTQ